MKIVIPFVHSEHDDLELLLSLQLLDNYRDAVDQVLIVGDTPRCLEDLRLLGVDVHVARTGRQGNSPVKDVLAKLKLACEWYGPDVDFLFQHDDLLVLQPNTEIRHEHRGQLGEKSGYWAAVAKNTQNFLGAEKSHLCYECHTPVMMNTTLFGELFAEVPRKDLLIKSCYLNQPHVQAHHAQVPVVQGANRKMRATDHLDRDTIRAYAKETPFLSLHHKVMRDELEACLNNGGLIPWLANT